MKLFCQKTIVFLFLLLIVMQGMSQSDYTPYDELSGINKNYKPAYEANFPEWAKKLYSYPINYQQLNAEFEAYMDTHPNEKSAVIRYFKIWRRVLEPFASYDGSIQLPDTKSVNSNLLATQLKSASKLKSATTAVSAWEFLGPKETYWLNESGSTTAPGSCPWQANVYSFDVSASNNQILYCGTETGYVNKTIDKGLSWQLLAQNYPFGGGVTAVAIHPANPDIVYVAAGKQIHKTTDGGLTWKPMLPLSNLFSTDRLRIDASNPEKIVAAANEGVFISSNGGTSWIKKWSAKTYDIEINPTNNNLIYAITKTSAGMFSVVLSVNGGDSFSALSSFPNNVTESSGGLLAVTEANPNLLFIVMLSSDNTPYLYKGTLSNSNWTWTKLATGNTNALGMNNGQGYFDLTLEVSPTNESIILVGTTTLYKSTNGGINYSAVGGYTGNFSIHPDIQDMKMLPNGETWVSTDGGIVLTTDNFSSAANFLVRINGLVGSDMWGFDQGWNEDLIVGGRYHNGNTAIADFYQDKALRMGGAESPTGWILQGKSRHVAFNDLGNGWILPKTAEGKPEGRFIFSKYPNMVEYGGRRSNIVHHPNYYGTLYVGEGTGLWMSEDLGVNYDLIYNFPDQIRYFQQSYSNPKVFYADVANYGLYKSSDGGQTWSRKTSLTNGNAGNPYWNGKLFISVSPYDENQVYACLQNGTWTADIGSIYKSVDGGDSWTNFTGSVSEMTKCMVIQPSDAGKDIVYLFTSSRNGKSGKVFYRTEDMNDWADFGNNYPEGMDVNLALPFFRDGKIRVGGNSGVWESALLEPSFTPILNPWIEKQKYNCYLDTLYFDDHSIVNHQGVTWAWSISPEPAYISNPNIRNPKVVLGMAGNFSVTMEMSRNGQVYSKTIGDMVSATTCPSIDDCSNPAELPKTNWSTVYFDSQEPNDPGLASMAIDGDPNTIWHTRWSTGTDNYPHEIQVDMGAVYNVHQFIYLPRQEGVNGRIKNYELYFSEDKSNWGTVTKTGEFKNSSSPETLVLSSPVKARYFKLKALSEVNGGAWTSVAELSVIGCKNITTSNPDQDSFSNLSAFPIPATAWVNITLPEGSAFNYCLYSASGKLLEQKDIDSASQILRINLEKFKAGFYFVRLINEKGMNYRIKLVRE